MNSDHEISNEHQQGDASHERLDWITRYLDLADKIIRAHMPGAPARRDES